MKSSSIGRAAPGVVAALMALVALMALMALGAAELPAQTPDAAHLRELVEGLTVTPRVLIINARPEDEDNRLIAWLSRGRHVETGVLSLTRGESGPNFLGAESGTVLGAVRTQEMLEARHIDGAEQFFTHGYDFGFARDTAEVFKRWNRDSIVGDIVSVIRSFRPHVIVVTSSDSDPRMDGQRAALAGLVADALTSAADTHVYPASVFGMPWRTAKLYHYGTGLVVRTDEFDPVRGKTYDAIALEARAQYRSQGLQDLALPTTPVQLQRVMPAMRDSSIERSIFDGIDTSLVRFVATAPHDVADELPSMAAYGDTARRMLDLRHPASAVAPLSELATLVNHARAVTPWCGHPARSAAPPPTAPAPTCDQATLDLEASLDLARQRVTDALLAAAGVEIDAVADRELIAASDTALVTITVANHGDVPITIGEVAVWGGMSEPHPALIVSPGETTRLDRTVAGLADPHPWWIESRTQDRFPSVMPSLLDGLARGDLLPKNLVVRSGAVPENYRRTSDVSVVVTISGTTVSTSIGPVVFPYADAIVGQQRRPIAGAPDVLLNFGRGLEWVAAQRPVTRDLHVFMRSNTKQPRAFTPSTPLVPKGLRVDSLPRLVVLGPREERDMSIHLRGRSPGEDREAFGLVGKASNGARYFSGFQTIQYANLLPIRVARSSGLWVQPVEITIPTSMSVIYVRGLGDDVPTALKDVGVTVVTVPAEDFLTIDISKVTTIVLGPRALELHHELAAQKTRLFNWVRDGGTLVVSRGDVPTLQWLPFAVSVSHPVAERVTRADAPVVAVEPNARVLSWPNAIRDTDWTQWVGERAQLVPSTVRVRMRSRSRCTISNSPRTETRCWYCAWAKARSCTAR